MKAATEPDRIAGSEAEEEIDLVELLGYYLTKLRLIICCLLAGALAAGLITHFMITPLYTASALIYMVSASEDSVVNLSDLNIGAALSEDYAVLMKTRPIALAVIEELELDYAYEELMDMVTIGAVGDTRVMQISVESPDPEEAMEIANAYAEEAVATLPELMETPEPNIAEEAIYPETKSSPNLTKNTLIGALAGMTVCIAVLTVLFLMDDTLKTEEDVEKMFGVMPLTVIPEDNSGMTGAGGENDTSRGKLWNRIRKGLGRK